jgi:hypothetical protein
MREQRVIAFHLSRIDLKLGHTHKWRPLIFNRGLMSLLLLEDKLPNTDGAGRNLQRVLREIKRPTATPLVGDETCQDK